MVEEEEEEEEEEGRGILCSCGIEGVEGFIGVVFCVMGREGGFGEPWLM